MIGVILRLVSTVATVIVALSFALFAIDEAGEGSSRQVQKLEGADEPAPSAKDERVREAENSDVRELIDDANDVLVKPFAGVVDSDSDWVERGVPFLLAFLVYGVALRILAAYASRA